MTPGLNIIPMAPSFMHVIGVVMGAVVTPSHGVAELVGFQKAKLVAAAATIIAIGGGIFFVGSTAYKAKQTGEALTAKPAPNATVNTSSPAVSAAKPLASPPPAKVASAHKAPENFGVDKLPANLARTEPKSAEKPVVRYIRMDD